MDKNIWNNLKKPIFVLAPMADVTDAAFRRIINKYGKPDIFYTEFVSADGLALAPEEGRKKLLKDLEYSEAEHPIVAQFFTASPENMKKAAELARSLGFDGVDINMGCPDTTVVHQGAGACLIQTPELARELIRAAKEGAGDLPVSVKTRAGFNKPELQSWLPELLAENPAAIIVHARTKKEMSKVPARWEFVKEAVEIRNNLNSKTLILGNGDVKNLDEAEARVEETGADGVMLGRAIFGNPWLFSAVDTVRKNALSSSTEDARSTRSVDLRDVFSHQYQPQLDEKLKVMVEHTKLFEGLLGSTKSFNIMKKHYKAYVNGFDGASDLRVRLMEGKDAREVGEIVDNFLDTLK